MPRADSDMAAGESERGALHFFGWPSEMAVCADSENSILNHCKASEFFWSKGITPVQATVVQNDLECAPSERERIARFDVSGLQELVSVIRTGG
jgi:hypothetical protein